MLRRGQTTPDGCDILEAEGERDVALTGSERGVEICSSVVALVDVPSQGKGSGPDSCPQHSFLRHHLAAQRACWFLVYAWAPLLN